jgi:putative DNA-invertase from lambdoid prophage Rac
MGVLNAVAPFERDLLMERTQSGLKRQGRGRGVLGRPATLDADRRKAVRNKLELARSTAPAARLVRVRDSAEAAV